MHVEMEQIEILNILSSCEWKSHTFHNSTHDILRLPGSEHSPSVRTHHPAVHVEGVGLAAAPVAAVPVAVAPIAGV